MADQDPTSNDETAPGQPQKATKPSRRTSADKWGGPVIELGFCVVPSLLFQAQRRLGLTPTQLTILLQLADYWWSAARKPFPKKADLAERLGLNERQVQRHIAALEKAGFVRRIARTAYHRGKISNEYDLSGLVEKLKALEPDFREAAREAKERRKAVGRPNYKFAKGGTMTAPANGP